jgi:hypothetical protein
MLFKKTLNLPLNSAHFDLVSFMDSSVNLGSLLARIKAFNITTHIHIIKEVVTELLLFLGLLRCKGVWLSEYLLWCERVNVDLCDLVPRRLKGCLLSHVDQVFE